MDNQTPPAPKAPVWPAQASMIDEANKDEPITSGRRLLINGGMLGACIVFLASMLSLTRLDTPLTIALYAFVVAIPCLGFGIVVAITRFEPYAKVSTGFMAASAIVGISVLCEYAGILAVYVGVGAVIAHFSRTALFVGLATVGFIVLTYLALTSLMLLLHRRRVGRVNGANMSRPVNDAQ